VNPVSHHVDRVLEFETLGICNIFLISKLNLFVAVIVFASVTMLRSPPIRNS